MAPKDSVEWQSHPSISEEQALFQESLKQSPFEGAAVAAALAKVIKVTDTLQQSSNGKISLQDASSFVVEHIAEARETAESAPDPIYAQIFQAQEKGWKGAIRKTRTSRAAKPQTQPTQTAKKSMSDGKSNNT